MFQVKKMRYSGILILAVLVLALVMSGCSTHKKVIKIGHKNFTEQRILGEMFALLIEDATDYEVDVKEFGGTVIAFEALKNGEIDICPEYTGTGYVALLSGKEKLNQEETYEFVSKEFPEKFDINWGIPLGFNNTSTFAVRKDVAKKYNLKTFSDLSDVADELIIVGGTEFFERFDGLKGAQECYSGLKFADAISVDPGLRYVTIEANEAQVMDAFTTDSKLIDLELVVLEDDKNFYPPYYVAPIVNGNFNREHPEILEILNQLGEQISEEEMQAMNHKVDNGVESERNVCKAFLQGKGLLKKD